MNGHAERLNRSLIEKARAMIIDSSIPKCFWGEAVRTAAYLLNRSPTTALENKTPYEMWNDKKPDLNNLRIFGSTAFLRKSKVSDKFDGKSLKCRMVGYGLQNTYRLWNDDLKCIKIGRDVIFDEQDMFKTQKSNNDNIVYIPAPVQEDKPIETVDSEKDSIDDLWEQEKDKTNREGKSESTSSSLPKRQSRPPAWHADYDTTYLAWALSAESFVSDVPLTYSDVMNNEYRNQWEQAMKEEMDAMVENKTWTLVDRPEGRKIINCRWVYKVKFENKKNICYKARLVAKGCAQKFGFDYTETYAPVANMVTIRTLLSIVNQKNLFLIQMDVKTAFLNGVLNEEVFMEQPEGYIQDKSKVCRLNKSIYGLKQAPRCWNRRFHEFITGQGYQQSESDNCLYIRSNDLSVSYLLLYVDDILLAGNAEKEISDIKHALCQEFRMKQDNTGMFLGMKIRWDKNNGVLQLDQRNYIDLLLNKFGLGECKPVKTPIEENVKIIIPTNTEKTSKPYREAVGCLMYLMIHTRLGFKIRLLYGLFNYNILFETNICIIK